MEKIDRSSWGSGPWDNEPDFHVVRYRGYKIVLSRSNLGNWRAYIGVPLKSKWARKEYYDQINVVGGVTWSETELPWGESEEGMFYIGFDYAHSNDFIPGLPLVNSRFNELREKFLDLYPLFVPFDKRDYKTMKYVIQEMKRVVKKIERE